LSKSTQIDLHELVRQGPVVLTKSACVQCTATTRLMDRLGVRRTEISIESGSTVASTGQTLHEMLLGLGLRAAPVVVVSAGSVPLGTQLPGSVVTVGTGVENALLMWSGFRPDLIRTVSQSQSQSQPETVVEAMQQ
jgi:glutaredoxin